MRLHFVKHEDIDKRVAHRPHGYRAALADLKLASNHAGVFFDIDDPRHQVLNRKFPHTPTPRFDPRTLSRPEDPLAAVLSTTERPLLGDRIEAWLDRVGIKAGVEWFEAVSGIPCGCDGRKALLNKVHALLREKGWLR